MIKNKLILLEQTILLQNIYHIVSTKRFFSFNTVLCKLSFGLNLVSTYIKNLFQIGVEIFLFVFKKSKNNNINSI